MKKILAALVVALAVATALSGCGATSQQQRQNAVLVLANAMNNPAPAADQLLPLIEEVAESQGELAVIVADGQPFAALPSTAIGSDDPSATSRNLQNESTCASLASQVASIAAKTPEVDILAALDMAQREAATMGEGSTKVIVYASGLSTTGLLNFQDGLISANPDELAKRLGGELPDLAGAAIEWFFCGDTKAPQKSPSSSQRRAIQTLWQAVIEACGGEISFADELPAEGSDKAAELPQVTCVDLPDPIGFSGSIELPDDATFGFVPDTAELLDEQAARAEIERLVQENPQAKACAVGVTGRTATLSSAPEDIECCDQLGLQRAQAIADLLIDAGIPEENVTVSTRGCRDNVGDKYDLDASGRQIPELAQANRTVHIQFEEGGNDGH